MDQVAVFIDSENVAIGAATCPAGRTNPVPYAALELVCREYGNASIRITPPRRRHLPAGGGDGDYSALVQRLREFGKHVVGVGTEASASPRLVSVCSEHKYWGTLKAAVDPSVRSAVEAAFDIALAERFLRTAMQESTAP